MTEQFTGLDTSKLGSELDAALTSLESVLNEATTAVTGIRAALPQIAALGKVIDELDAAMASARQHLGVSAEAVPDEEPAPNEQQTPELANPAAEAPAPTELPTPVAQALASAESSTPAPPAPLAEPPSPEEPTAEGQPSAAILHTVPAEAPAEPPASAEPMAEEQPPAAILHTVPAEAPAGPPSPAEPMAEETTAEEQPPAAILHTVPAEAPAGPPEGATTQAEPLANTAQEAGAGPSGANSRDLRLRIGTSAGSLDLKAVDRSINENPGVVDVTLLDYDGSNATLKVWVDESADAIAARDGLLTSLKRHLGDDGAVEVSIDFDEESAA